MAGTEPNSPPDSASKTSIAAGAHISGDMVMGDKSVTMTAGGDIVLGDKITNISNIYQAPSWGEARFERNRQAMIQNVRDIWVKGVLESSLYGDVLIQLDLAYKPEDVEHAWNLDPRLPDPAARRVPANALKIDLFDQANGALLILGQPGAGKTTTLLELARDLLDRAEQKPTAPVPVVFSLASWSEKHPPLASWLAEELFRRYDVPRKLGRAWLDEEMLIPLLDGLDEVPSEQCEACVLAINAFRADYGLAPLVVCSRIADYEALSARLRLRAAVVVQPLTAQQVDAHLARFGERHALLRSAVQQREDLRELTHTPLMLGVMMVVYQGRAGEIALKGSPADQRAYLFSQYVARMLERPDALRVYTDTPPPGAAQRDRSPYPDRLTLHWLSWLARTMRQHGQTLFFLEWMQPSWLPSPAQAALVSLGTSVLVGLVAGLVFSAVSLVFGVLNLALGASSLGSVRFFILDLVYKLVAGLTGGPAGGLIGQFVGHLRGGNRALRRAGVWLSAVAALAVLLGGGLVMAALGIGFGETDTGVSILVVSGWLVAFAGGLVGYSRTISAVEQLHWSRQGSRSGLDGLFIGASSAALAGGFLAWLLKVPGTVSRLSATDGPFVALLAGLITGWVYPFLVGATFWIVGGLVGWLRGSITTLRLTTRRSVNEGLWRSARSSVIGALIGGMSAGLVCGLIGWGLALLAFGPAKPFQAALVIGLAIGLAFGAGFAVIGGVTYGGRAVIQHALLRLLLWRNGYTPGPGDYPRFLDYAADRVLLRKVGGGYIFIHPLLMDYLAGLDA